jgi:ElaB/YqjD/DUF883 family membrane-anchored ribosome-binding protein
MKVGLLGALLALSLVAPGLVIAQDRRGDRTEQRFDDEDEDRSVMEDLEETLRTIPRRLEQALGDVKRELDPEKARELKRRLERTLENLKDAIDPRTDKVRVHVGDRTMDVPAKKGAARLY